MNLTVRLRDKRGKGAAHRARAQNRVPGILYGRGFASQTIDVDERALLKALLMGAGDSHLIDLQIESAAAGTAQSAEKALIKALQRNPVTERIEHVDFYRVIMTEKIEVDVPVVLTGSAAGIKKGGVLEKRLDAVRVRCLPGNIPENFTVDVAHLDLGDNVNVSALTAPADVAILTDPDRVIAVVTEIKVVEEAAPVAAAAAPEEGAAAAAPGAAPGAVPGAAAPAAAESKEKKGAEGDKKEAAKEKPKGKG